MKKFCILLLAVLTVLFAASCSDDDQTESSSSLSSAAVSTSSSGSSSSTSDAGSTSSGSSSSASQSAAVNLPLYTDSYAEFSSDGWSIDAAGSYYSDYLKFTSDGQYAISPKFTAGAGKITFDLISGSTTGPVSGLAVYGSVDGSTYTQIGPVLSTPGSGIKSSHEITPATDANLSNYQYIKFVMGNNNGSIGLAMVWITPPGSGCAITSFKFKAADNPGLQEDIIGTVNESAKTVSVTVPYSTELNNLIADFTLSSGATAKIGTTLQQSGITANNFSSQLTYTVTAEDSSEAAYTVTVNKAAARTGNELTKFQFLRNINPMLQEDITATINDTAKTVSITVPYYVTLTGLKASFTVSDGATVSVNGTAQTSGQTVNDFSSPLSYTVRAEDGNSAVYTVSVTQIPARTGKSFTMFKFDRDDNWFLPEDILGTINESAKTVSVEIPYNTSPNSLKPSFSVSDGATVTVDGTLQQSGTVSHDFTTPIIYRVTAEDSSYAEYTVSVSVAAALTGHAFTDFRFTAAENTSLTQDITGTIDAAAGTVNLLLPWGVDRNQLTASFSNSPGSSVSIGTTAQTSGVTVNNFSSAVTYTIKAQDGTEQNWVISVSNADQIMVTSVSITPDPLTLPAGHSSNLTASVSPADASIQTVAWNSSDENIVSVTTSGTITAHSAGTATITATAQDGSTVSGSATITVPALNYATGLIISEYIEGSLNNKYIEIYNGTGSTVDLSDFSLELHTAAAVGATATNQLSGQLDHGKVFIIANSQANLTGSFTVGLSTGSLCNFNGDDAIVLRRISDDAVIDIVGTIDGNDPGSAWLSSDESYSTAEKTLVRKPTVKSGYNGSNFVTESLDTQWTAYPQNYADNLGLHTMYFD